VERAAMGEFGDECEGCGDGLGHRNLDWSWLMKSGRDSSRRRLRPE
jgi:hypothetical protein